jgi:CBS domain-containing protein
VTLELAPDAEPTVEEAARAMEEAGVSSVLLLEPGGTRPVGIVTDRDLRGRVLARGRGASTPIREVMTHPVDWIPAETPGAEALLQLLRQGRHHLLIEDDGALRGVVTTSDLLRRHLQGPTALLDRLRSARSPDQLTDWTAWVGSMVETLHHSGTRATDIGRIVAAVNDALGARLLAWTEAELGEAPCAYAWLVHGSEGRQEQSFVTDQDNALAYADATPSAEAYFRRLAETMIESLIRVGFPPCAGGFMASHWCHPVAEWERLFTSWIEEPDPESLMRVVNFFDWRSTHGTLDLAPLDAIVAASGRNHRFLGQLARASMRKRPPLGLFRQIVEDEGGVDLKSGALMPISGLARLYAVEAGDHHGSTLQRLSRAARAGVLSADGAELLAEAFRFTFGLRMRSQLADRAAGRPLGPSLDLDSLDAAERHHLREVFLAIRRLQRITEDRLGSGGLG